MTDTTRPQSRTRFAPRAFLARHLTVRPLLFALSLVVTVVFVAVLVWGLDSYAAFSRTTRQADLKQTVRILIERGLDARHVPAVSDMASGIVAEAGFKPALARKDAAALGRILRDNFGQKYVATGQITLLSLTVFDETLAPIAETKARSFRTVPWDGFLAALARRSGAQRKRIAMKYMLDANGEPVHVMVFPVGALRTLGYMGIVTSPLPALSGLGRTLDATVTIQSLGGRELLKQTPAPAAQDSASHGDSAPHGRIFDTVRTSFATKDGVELFRLLIKTDVTAWEDEARKVQRISYAIAFTTILLVWGVGFWLMRAIVFRRIAAMSSALRRITAGERVEEVEIPPAGEDEIGQMSRDMKTVVGYVSEIVALKENLSTTNTRLHHEIAERVRIEADLRAAKEQADFANRAKSEFLANMSHELRTPLNAVIGFSELIKSEAFGPVGTEQYRDYANDINESGQHLLGLINDILDLSKIESGAEDLHEEAIGVPQIAESALRLVQQRAARGAVTLEVDVPGDLPLLHADARKLKQILVNLLSNAIKFTEPGGKVSLSVRRARDRGHEFEISDTGIGIAHGDLQKIFAPFQQADSDLNRKYEGTGLGLPLTMALVEMHEASLTLESQLGVGTTVTVCFPPARTLHLPANAPARQATG